MGSPEVRSFSRGKRGIAGSMVFTIFDRDALIAALKEHVKREKSFYRIGSQDLEYRRISIDEWDKQMTDIALKGANGTGGEATNVASSDPEQVTKNISVAAEPVYADEIPPFDVTISFANEYGQKAVIVLYACEILNESSGFSIDNVISEKACTFVARKVEYMKPVGREGSPDVYTSWSGNGGTTV
jgi:hypothetical protein